MTPDQRRVLTILWVLAGITFVVPWFLPDLAWLAGMVWIPAIILAFVTYRALPREDALLRAGWYRLALGFQLACALAGAAGAAPTVLVGGQIGFVTLATLGVAAAISTWRALTRPSARRAVASALVMICGTSLALIADVLLGIYVDGASRIARDEHAVWHALMAYAILAASVVTAAVHVVALHAFGAASTLPTARARS